LDHNRQLKLAIVPGEFAIHRFAPDAALPEAVLFSGIFSITRTEEELSIVCGEHIPLGSPRCEGGWSCIKVIGPLGFSLTGILAHLAGLLAENGISLFALSTFDTDYLLVKTDQLTAAVDALKAGGHRFA
jgi:hypothetical protein